MPTFLAKQPNGRFAAFSSVVDAFTVFGMNAAEALDFCMAPRPNGLGLTNEDALAKTLDVFWEKV